MSTTIQIKRSQETAIPPSLAEGELAWSGNGDILFIGSNSQVVPVTGRRDPGTLTANQALVANSTSYIDEIKVAEFTLNEVSVTVINAISNSTVLGLASNTELTTTWAIKTYVDEKVSESAGAAEPGGSNTQVQYNDSGVMGGSAAFVFNETNNTVSISNTLAIGSNVTANTTAFKVGNTTVNAIITSTSIALGNSSVNVNIDSDSLTLGETVVNTTSIHVNGTMECHDLEVSGNLAVTGTVTTIDAENITVSDPLIKLARQNDDSDILDIGFYGMYFNSANTYTGLFRDATDNKFKLFHGLTDEPSTTVDTGGTGYTQGTLVCAIESNSANISGGLIDAGEF